MTNKYLTMYFQAIRKNVTSKNTQIPKEKRNNYKTAARLHAW